MSIFKKASRAQQKLKLGITGPSGSGKTWGALTIAQSMGCKKIAVIDSENGSADLYSDKFKYDTAIFEAPYSPEDYIRNIQAAVDAGYDCVILDSITPVWSGRGGCLDLVNRIPGNSFVAWSKITPRFQSFVDAILACPIHLICTMRSKTAYILEENSQGKMVPTKKGMDPQIRDNFEYELTSVFDLNLNHYFTASKDRTSLFGGDIPQPLDESVGKKLLAWLNSGEKVSSSPEVSPNPEPAATVVVPTVQDQANALSAALDAIETLEDVKTVEQTFTELKPALSPKALEFLQLKLNKARAKVEGF